MTSAGSSTASALVENGELVLEEGSLLPAPWWSLTKTAIAAAALVLVEQRRFALDEPLAPAPYTLRHLLQHTSGLRDYGGLASYNEAVARRDAPWSDATLLAAVNASDLLGTPGERFAYSNVGYLMVRRLIEQTTDLSLDEALRRLVFMPLGVAGVAIASGAADLERTAWGNDGYHPGWVYHGLAVGTAAQAALFITRLCTGDLLTAAMRETMMQPFPVAGVLLHGRPWREPGYGLGVMVDRATPIGRCVGHTGGGPGSTTATYYFPALDRPRAAAVFSPTGDGGRTEHAALDLARRGAHPAM